MTDWFSIPARVARKTRRRLRRADVVNRGGNGVVNFIDVGSVGGLPGEWRDHARLVRNLLNFEPMETERRRGSVLTIPAALWSASETKTFYIVKGGDHGNSLLEPNLDYVRANFDTLSRRGAPDMAETWFERSAAKRTIEIQTTTLDAVLEGLGPQVRYDFLKIDAQGAELPILQGAERFLAHDCVGMLLESFVIPLFKGMALLDDLDGHLNARGFERVLTAPAHGTFASQHDVVYLRRDASESPALKAIRGVYGLT